MKLPAPVLETRGRFTIVRDDLLAGGSKMRFLPFLVKGAKEIVFGGPFCGGAPYALSVLGKQTGQKITLFYAQRAVLHPRQVAAQQNGANLVFVRPGYMTVVQARARDYAQQAGALFLPLGFDVPQAEEPFVEAMVKVRKKIHAVDQVWCCAGSGMLARCLSKAFPDSEINAVIVGLASRNEAQPFGFNVRLHQAPYKFEQRTKSFAPFPSCANYDRKAWEICSEAALGRALFWNVLG